MKGIFISYRRADSAPYADAFATIFVARSHPSACSWTSRPSIRAPTSSRPSMRISPTARWSWRSWPAMAEIRDSNGQRRVEDPNDYVVRELATAIQRQANVIPLLVGGAQMPSATTLPPSLQELSRRNAMEISDSRFAEDAERLCKAIAGALDLPQDDAPYRERVSTAGSSRMPSSRRRAPGFVAWSGQLCTAGAVHAVRSVLEGCRTPEQLRSRSRRSIATIRSSRPPRSVLRAWP